MDFYGFYLGEEFEAYRYLGAQLTQNGVSFRTFAPNAKRIAVIGEFNNWQGTEMEKIYDGNFWEVQIEDAKINMMYKFRIYRDDGIYIDHCDPYGFSAELRPNTASIIYDLKKHHFEDVHWMRRRSSAFDQAVNIYELHAGSWKKKEPDSPTGIRMQSSQNY